MSGMKKSKTFGPYIKLDKNFYTKFIQIVLIIIFGNFTKYTNHESYFK